MYFKKDYFKKTIIQHIVSILISFMFIWSCVCVRVNSTIQKYVSKIGYMIILRKKKNYEISKARTDLGERKRNWELRSWWYKVELSQINWQPFVVLNATETQRWYFDWCQKNYSISYYISFTFTFFCYSFATCFFLGEKFL